MKNYTEQDIIDGNIVLARYHKDFKEDLPYRLKNYSTDSTTYIHFMTSENGWYSVGADYHGNMNTLWQVLQKIEEFVKVHKIDDTRYSDYPTLSQKYWELEMLVSKKSDPLDIFWAAVEFIKECNKYLKK